MKRYIASLLIFCTIAAPMLLLAYPSKGQEAEFDRQAMLENLASNVILPAHQAFVDQTVLLQEAAAAFQGSPSLETLAALQQSWRDTSDVWEKARLFELGRESLVYHSEVDNHSPVATDVLEGEILPGTDPIDEASIAGRGSNLKGMRTLEYLIFNIENDPAAVLARYTSEPNAERRMQYLVAATDLLHSTALLISDMWAPEGGNYTAEFIEAIDGTSVLESISMLANQMMGKFEHIIQMSIGTTLGANLGVVDPAYVMAPYSGYSIEQAISYMEIMQQTFNGDSEAGDGLGFDDYLNYLDATYEGQPLSEVISAQIEKFLTTLRSLDHDALRAQPDLIQPAYADGILLLRLMKVDMVAQMGITITFTDNDGD